MLTLAEYFDGHAQSRQLFDMLLALVNAIGPAEIRITKSQVSFRRRRAFAWVWMPGKYLQGKHAPLVLTLSFSARNTSTRWKEIVEPVPGCFTHHLELYTLEDIDQEVRQWLEMAWTSAG